MIASLAIFHRRASGLVRLGTYRNDHKDEKILHPSLPQKKYSMAVLGGEGEALLIGDDSEGFAYVLVYMKLDN